MSSLIHLPSHFSTINSLLHPLQSLIAFFTTRVKSSTLSCILSEHSFHHYIIMLTYNTVCYDYHMIISLNKRINCGRQLTEKYSYIYIYMCIYIYIYISSIFAIALTQNNSKNIFRDFLTGQSLT